MENTNELDVFLSQTEKYATPLSSTNSEYKMPYPCLIVENYTTVELQYAKSKEAILSTDSETSLPLFLADNRTETKTYKLLGYTPLRLSKILDLIALKLRKLTIKTSETEEGSAYDLLIPRLLLIN